VVREGRLSDAAEIATLTNELGYAADAAAISRRLQGILGKPNDLVTVVACDGEIAGWLQAHAAVVVETGFRVEIVGLIVGARFRRRGIGRALVEHAEQWAAGIGAEVIVVRSNTKRVESHRFYPALGYGLSKTQTVFRKNFAKTSAD
jgi:GNAT superfamily N-acetyltransferase